MTSATDDQPDLELGASGEGVILLQVRLYGLGLYRQIPDGSYDMVTEQAVRELQSQLGLDNDGEVHRETWAAIDHQELQLGIQYRYLSPYDALSQIVYDLEHAPVLDGELSEDGQWRWDGHEWQAVDGVAVRPGDRGDRELSADGQWEWNGSQWVAATPVEGTATAGGAPDEQLSPDGQWRWDGTAWQAVAADDHAGLLSDDGQWRWDGRQWQPA